MITKPLILILIIAGLTISSLPQTRRNTIARPVSSLTPFDPIVEKLPAGFQGINLQDLLGQFVLRVREIKRGEYETKDAYSKRISNLQDSTISGSLTLKSTLAFVLTPQTEYLPDNGELFAGVALHGSLSSDVGKQGVLRISGTHTTKRSVIQSSSGAKVPTTIDIQSNYALAIDRIDGNWTDGVVSKSGYGIHIKMSPAEAKTTRENLRILAVCSMVAPFVDSGENTVEPTPTQTQGESIIEQYAAVVLHDLWLFDQSTGRILARATTSRPKSAVAENVPPKPKVDDPPETKPAEPLAVTEELLLKGDRLPPEYTGIDPVKAWPELYKIGGGFKKDEFETSTQFDARYQERLKQTTIDKMPLDSLFSFQLDNPTFQYDADNGSMRVKIQMNGYDLSPEITKSTEVLILKRVARDYRGSDLYSLEISNYKDFAYTLSTITFDFNVTASAAREGKPYMKVMAVCILQKPFATMGYSSEHCIHTRLSFFLVYNFQTGEIYSRFPSSNKLEPIANNFSFKDGARSEQDRALAEAASRRASQDLQIGLYVSAQMELERAIDLVPNEPRYRGLLSIAFNNMNDFKKAEANARIAIQLNPNNSIYFELLGFSLMQQNKLEEAEKALGTSIRLLPVRPAAHKYLAEIALQQGNLLKAETEFGIANKIDPKDKETKNKLKEVRSRIKKDKK